jgi:protein-S-isoprenylcysteine O-methyltransferase Ste14
MQLPQFAKFVAKAEEAENLQRFGDDYAAYMKTTTMFLPFLF